jgi:hypothetical protein
MDVEKRNCRHPRARGNKRRSGASM